jgi:hypothetical protein
MESSMTKAKEKTGKLKYGPGDKTQFGLPTSGSPPPWQATVGTYLGGQAHVDEMDLVAIEMEKRWGAGRLRLVVDPILREKFDRQRYLINQALWHGELQDVIRESKRMISAWQALDRAAVAAGRHTLAPEVWEVTLASGTVAAIVRDSHHASKVAAENRSVRVYTLEEIGHLLHGFPELSKAKATFPGAAVERVSTRVIDPLQALPDSKAPIDDPIPF